MLFLGGFLVSAELLKQISGVKPNNQLMIQYRATTKGVKVT